MNPLARAIGIGVLGLAGFGLVTVVSDPPDIHPDPSAISVPTLDNRPELLVDPDERMTFDHPTAWVIGSTHVAEIWSCDGGHRAVHGPASVKNVCALALRMK